MEGHKPKIPRVVAGIAVHTLPLAPIEGFVLSRIDASATVTDIADLTSLEVDEVLRIVDKLIALGAVEWADGAAHLPRMSQRSAAPPRPTPSRPSQVPVMRHIAEARSALGGGPRPGPSPSPSPSPSPATTSNVAKVFKPDAARTSPLDGLGAPSAPAAPPPPAASPAASAKDASPAATTSTSAAADKADPAAPSDGIELAPERRKRIDDLYVAIDLLDHYEVLGVSHKAAKNDIRSAYFELSKVFHPDTAFRKNVGAYRQKMETIFKRLTEAYEVLGKKKSRDEYDAYLASIGSSRDAEEALSGENEIPAELRGDAPAAAAPATPVAAPAPTSQALPPPPPTPEPPVPPTRSAPTEEGRRVARAILTKRLGGSRPGTAPAAPPPTPPPAPAPDPTPAPERSKKEVLRDLASSLKSAAAQTGGIDRVTRLLAEAQESETKDDLSGAVRAYRLAMAMAPERAEITQAHDRVAKALAISLAGQYESQAIYEEKHQKWATAATNWAKVIEGRPDDVRALTRAAVTLLEANGDLHTARRFAQRAVDLAPDDVPARVALGRVFHAAGLALNAKRELEVARKLDPANVIALELLKEIQSRPT